MKYGQLLSVMTDELEKANISSPGVEARAILCAAMKIPYDNFLHFISEKVTEPHESLAKELILKRVSGFPVAYLCGCWEFYGLEFVVDPSVLIPRIDTELLVDVALRRKKDAQSILDLCTGSGCVGITLAKLTGAKVILSDLSSDALNVCRQNAETLLRTDQYKTELRDARIRRTEKNCFDLIVSNPPYVTEQEYNGLEPEVKDYEPRMALVGKDNGMEFYRSVPGAVYDALIPGGVIVFECGFSQSKAVADCLEAAGFTQIEFDKDTAGILRDVSAIKPFQVIE